ncbi:PSD1 and planctomycete cytochrome C domain-containing protein [Haloferula helveola]
MPIFAVFLAPALAAGEVDFSTQIRPLLSDRCFACHGFDDQKREADLGLHTFEMATAELDGRRAIVPGDPDASELMKRITSHDPEEVMPPAKGNKERLTTEQVELFRQWIDEGANYEPHWAFAFPEQAEPPSAGDGWARNPIDRFIAGRLANEGLKPSPEADPVTLLRRVSFDLTGLPPTPEDTDVFLAAWRKDKDQAWNDLLDRLFASPRYGERWARRWLDTARYSDTNGYEKDRPRSIWPFRDWVIKAINADMPFDRFSIEQLAGDMLPNATVDQKVATGFHRNTMLNEEGGIDPLEYRYHALVDRVGTTGLVWMGLTIECAQCHTHKFDPITHTDYYSMMAFFDQADEPEMAVPDPDTKRRQDEWSQKIAAAEDKLVAGVDEAAFSKWLEGRKAVSAEWTALEPSEMQAEGLRLTHEGGGVVFAQGDFTKRDVYRLKLPLPDGAAPVTALRIEALPDERLPAGGPGVSYYEGRSGDFFLSELKASVGGKPVRFGDGSVDFGKIAIGSGDAKAANVHDGNGSTGWSAATREGEPHEIVLNLADPVAAEGVIEVEMLFERHFVAGLGKFRISVASADSPLEARVFPPVDPLSSPERDLRLAFAKTDPSMKKARAALERLESGFPKFPTSLVMKERPADHQRVTQRHHRGEYLQGKEPVSAAPPSVFPALPEGAPANRLEFAKWLVDPERNPLVARVTVNRAWNALFGRGLVRSAGDFGYQSEPPVHPELLDWLAVEFVKRGWSRKALHRLIVDSATYRQSSAVDSLLLERDPFNELLARGPRFRMDGEMIRDAALATSGLLQNKIGGPSVRPPQPDSVTTAAYGAPKWNASSGPDRYRRSLYTYSKRTAPFAAYLTFDGPTGESCVVQRERSNTPLQALTLLNDEMFTEAAVALAKDAVDVDAAPAETASDLFRRVLSREPAPEELEALVAYHADQVERVRSGDLKPGEILPGGGATPELAAWAMTARVLYNLDEAITRN